MTGPPAGRPFAESAPSVNRAQQTVMVRLHNGDSVGRVSVVFADILLTSGAAQSVGKTRLRYIRLEPGIVCGPPRPHGLRTSVAQMAGAYAKSTVATASGGGLLLSLDRVPDSPPFPGASNTSGQSQVLTLKQTAAYLRISKAHLSNVINRKVAGVPPLRHAREGRRILIKRQWADEWLEVAGQESFR
jgi:hypothetical protein